MFRRRPALASSPFPIRRPAAEGRGSIAWSRRNCRDVPNFLRLGSGAESDYARGVAKPDQIELPDGTFVPILYEDRAVLAIDKPVGWMLAPGTWDKTSRNLHL